MCNLGINKKKVEIGIVLSLESPPFYAELDNEAIGLRSELDTQPATRFAPLFRPAG
jgi:hypothetical protein